MRAPCLGSLLMVDGDEDHTRLVTGRIKLARLFESSAWG